MLGVAYKQDIDDYRESPAIPIINILEKNGADVDFYDPYIKSFKENGKITEGLDYISAEDISKYDLIMITCAHTNIDYDMIQKNAKAIFDTKNIMSDIAVRDNIEVL